MKVKVKTFKCLNIFKRFPIMNCIFLLILSQTIFANDTYDTYNIHLVDYDSVSTLKPIPNLVAEYPETLRIKLSEYFSG